MICVLRLLFWTLPILLWDGIRLVGLVICLFPGFVRMFWYYSVKANRKSVRFGKGSCRHTLDVYTTANGNSDSDDNQAVDNNGTATHSPASTTSLMAAPVVLFFTGGAWLIGYKMWGALLARALNASGIVVVVPDYRNYPWASVPDMVSDVEQALSWTLDNIADYGGDPEKIVVVGQSAGGHLVCTALLRRAMDIISEHSLSSIVPEEPTTSDEEEHVETWSPTDFKGFISLSSPYNLQAMARTFTKHGLDENLIDRIFGGERENFDPYHIVQECQRNEIKLTGSLPPIQICHGSFDNTVPHEGSEEFCREIQQVTDDQVTFTSYEGWSHTDAILEGPLDADHRFHCDVFHDVQEWTDSFNLTWPEQDPSIKYRLCPHLLVQAGRFCNPF
jgi:prenylcysteine alpha-carboxyl methylesterase